MLIYHLNMDFLTVILKIIFNQQFPKTKIEKDKNGYFCGAVPFTLPAPSLSEACKGLEL